METKSNQATPQRPEGDRILDADLVQMDLTDFIRKIKEESKWVESDRNSMTIYKSDKLTIVLLGMRQNAELKTHQSNGIISVQVLEGKLKFSTERQTVSLEQGQMIALRENIPHSVAALTETFFLLTVAMTEKESFWDWFSS